MASAAFILFGYVCGIICLGWCFSRLPSRSARRMIYVAAVGHLSIVGVLFSTSRPSIYVGMSMDDAQAVMRRAVWTKVPVGRTWRGQIVRESDGIVVLQWHLVATTPSDRLFMIRFESIDTHPRHWYIADILTGPDGGGFRGGTELELQVATSVRRLSFGVNDYVLAAMLLVSVLAPCCYGLKKVSCRDLNIVIWTFLLGTSPIVLSFTWIMRELWW